MLVREATSGALHEVVLHTANETPYATIIAALDATRAAKVQCGRARTCPALHVTFATD
jgi:hypothetical protein